MIAIIAHLKFAFVKRIERIFSEFFKIGANILSFFEFAHLSDVFLQKKTARLLPPPVNYSVNVSMAICIPSLKAYSKIAASAKLITVAAQRSESFPALDKTPVPTDQRHTLHNFRPCDKSGSIRPIIEGAFFYFPDYNTNSIPIFCGTSPCAS